MSYDPVRAINIVHGNLAAPDMIRGASSLDVTYFGLKMHLAHAATRLPKYLHSCNISNYPSGGLLLLLVYCTYNLYAICHACLPICQSSKIDGSARRPRLQRKPTCHSWPKSFPQLDDSAFSLQVLGRKCMLCLEFY